MKSKYPDINKVMYNKIMERVIKFKYSQIDNIIKETLRTQIEESGPLFMSTYYEETLSKVLNNLVYKGYLSCLNNVYTPTDYQIKTEYEVKDMNLTYSYGLIRGNNECINDIEYFEEIEIIEQTTKENNNQNIILTGPTMIGGDYEQPQVPLYEIRLLYHKFISQGASKEQTILGILNYYNAKKLEGRIYNEKYPNRYMISPRSKKKSK